MNTGRSDVSIVLCGEAGQGIQTVETLLVRLLKQSGSHVFAVKEYMSRTGWLNLDAGLVSRVVRDAFGGKDPAVTGANLAAVEQGMAAGKEKVRLGLLSPPLLESGGEDLSGEVVLSGAEVVGLGALAGGCDFLSSYPMSPSTGVMTFLAGRARDFGVIVEQADLDFVRSAGHGEFPRVILAPGSLEEGFDLTRKAFDLADGLQIPVVILTDQHLMDSIRNLPPFDVGDSPPRRHVVRTGRDYRRYALTPDGISPRGIPGFGEGLVSVDSDEHDEAGHITEDLEMRVKMIDKRLAKGRAAAAAAISPRLTGPADAETLVVSWGSTGPAVDEALTGLGRGNAAHLHFSQVHPLHPDAGPLLRRARRRVCVEGNATGQFRRLLESAAGVGIEHGVQKYNGPPFAVEEIAGRLDGILREGR